MANSQRKRWCFTLNNFTPAEYDAIVSSVDNYDYLVVGKEVGESGTPHLQGFFILKTKLRLNQVKALVSARAHFEAARGTPSQASLYCKKDGEFFEHGELPQSQGKRTDFDRLKDWIKELDTPPAHVDIAEEFPSLWGRYKSACLNFVELFGPRPQLTDGEFKPWQRQLNDVVEQQPGDRRITFVVDPRGGKGKSWLTRYWFTKRTDIQRLSIGKRDDLAFAIDVSKRVFVFDIPRGQSEFLQYSILEQLKDQMIFSPKYESTTKVLPTPVHVIVFMNERPNMDKMTRDRYHIINLI